jgi:hypothetical protein
MNDSLNDDVLSRRLKRATAQVAATTPRDPRGARSIARRPNAPGLRSAPRRLGRPGIMVVVALVVGVLLAAGTAYAGITLLQSVTQGDPGAAAVYQQNLGEALNLSQTRGGVTLTLQRAYADINRVMITYQVRPARSGSIFAGFATTNGQPTLTDSRGQVLAGYDSVFQTDPQTDESVGIVVYDAEIAARNVRELSVRVTVPGLRMSDRSGHPTTVGPFAFALDVPVVSGQTIALDDAVTVRGVAVTLDRVVASPSETRVYLRSSIGFASAEPYLAAYITGKGFDTRTAVITNDDELVTAGSTFRAPDGEEVVTFNDTVFGRHGSFVLTIESIGAAKRIAGPWVFRFTDP